MKKNKVLLLGIITVFVAIFSLTLVSGTWAKYTSEVSGTSTATVAKWAWKVDSTKVVGDGTTATSFNVNLFKTIKEEDTTTEETDVKNGLIAPGTGGQLSFTVENASEVSGKVVLKFEESENLSNIPLEYSVDGNACLSLDLLQFFKQYLLCRKLLPVDDQTDHDLPCRKSVADQHMAD